MKCFLAIIILVLIPFTLLGQEFSVESLKLLSTDASSNSELKKDINDVPCALLHVVTNESNVKFGGNVIDKATFDGKQYVMNIASGTKKIQIVKRGVYPLGISFMDYNTKINALKSNCEYEIVLKIISHSNEVSGQISNHDYVDMGLSVNWATCNLGASNIGEQGDLYKYGEIEKYDSIRPYSFMDEGEWNDYKPLTKNTDAAYTKWGLKWRMPTKLEWWELVHNCQLIWTTRNGIYGAMFIAKNGNKLFFPVEVKNESNFKLDLWTNDISLDLWTKDGPVGKYKLDVGELVGTSGSYWHIYPSTGRYIRPVTYEPEEKSKKMESWQFVYPMKPDGYCNGYPYVDLGLSVKWATTNLSLNYGEDNETRFCWGETEPCPNDDKFNEGTYKYGIVRNEYDNSYYDTNADRKYGVNGASSLQIEDDAASVSWKSSWRTPTKEEMEELLTKCKWTWTYNYHLTHLSGYVIASKVPGYEDKSIFLPCRSHHWDHTKYWTSNRERKFDSNENNCDTSNAYCLCFSETHYHLSTDGRERAILIRPVCK